MNQKNQKKHLISRVKPIVLFILSLLLVDVLVIRIFLPRPVVNHEVTLEVYTASRLATFDGSDVTKPTYLALDGFVYDISSGRDAFYAPNKPYHMLAGTDASALLHIVGAEIITRKYKIVGRFIL